MAEQLYAILLPNALGKKLNPKSITPKSNLILIILIMTSSPKRVKIGNDIMMDEL